MKWVHGSACLHAHERTDKLLFAPETPHTHLVRHGQHVENGAVEGGFHPNHLKRPLPSVENRHIGVVLVHPVVGMRASELSLALGHVSVEVGDFDVSRVFLCGFPQLCV